MLSITTRGNYTSARRLLLVNSYSALLRGNRNFRLLWFGQIVSQLGDWFNAVAVFALLLDLTGSARAVAWMMITQFLPIALVGPLAGVAADRVNRRRLMIAADIFRGIVILGLLLVRRADQIWLAYVVTAATVAATAFFEPARTATIPGITTDEELLPANALASASWSAMLAIGAALGGLVTALFGREAAFLINSVSFFASACLIGRTRFSGQPQDEDARRFLERQGRAATLARVTGLTDLRDGFRYVRSESRVAALMLVKAGWGLAGGVLLLLTIYGQRVFPVAGSAAGGIGILFGARGIGAGIGPILVRAVLGQRPRTLRRAIGAGYFLVGIFYVALAWMPNVWLASLAVMGAHMGGSILWVFSTVLLQIEVPDRFRGRVFAAELALVTLTSSASSYVTGYTLDERGWSPQALSIISGIAFAVPGTAWMIINARWRDEGAAGVSAGQPATGEDLLETRVG